MKMLWCVAVVAAVVSAVQGQIISYDGRTFVNDDAQPAMIVQAPSSVPAPASALAQSFTVIPAPAPAPSAVPPVVVAQPPTFLPPPQPSFIPVTASVGAQFGIPQGGLPLLPACPSTPSLVHFSYGGSLYHFSWCHYQSGQHFTHQHAADYCRSLNGFHQGLHFDVIRIEDLAELSLIHNVVTYYAQFSVWTRDTSSTAPYSIRLFILGSDASFPGHDCVSVESTHSGVSLRVNSCSDLKTVVCEARY